MIYDIIPKNTTTTKHHIKTKRFPVGQSTFSCPGCHFFSHEESWMCARLAADRSIKLQAIKNCKNHSGAFRPMQ